MSSSSLLKDVKSRENPPTAAGENRETIDELVKRLSLEFKEKQENELKNFRTKLETQTSLLMMRENKSKIEKLKPFVDRTIADILSDNIEIPRCGRCENMAVYDIHMIPLKCSHWMCQKCFLLNCTAAIGDREIRLAAPCKMCPTVLHEITRPIAR